MRHLYAHVYATSTLKSLQDDMKIDIAREKRTNDHDKDINVKITIPYKMDDLTL